MARSSPWTPSQSDYERVFAEQNPWHATAAVPQVLACQVERPMGRQLWRRVLHGTPLRYQLVLGPRRVGKTTAMYQTVRHLLAEGVPPDRLWWLRLDHPLLMAVPVQDLVRYAMKSAGEHEGARPTLVFLDELTYAKDWDLWLKTFYDEKWPIRVVGTSSSTAALRHRRVESGVGRWEEQYLGPYLLTEYLELVGHRVDVPVEPTLARTVRAAVAQRVSCIGIEPHRRRFLLTGGFPELLLMKTSAQTDDEHLVQSQRVLRSDAVERAIYKDIPQAFGVDNPMMLERLLYVAAGQIAGIVSPRAICGALDGLSQPTFDRYLAYLERAFLVFTLPNFSGSEAAVQKRGRKLYFVDGAVRNAALQRGVAPSLDPGEMGLLLENLVASHLHALCQLAQVRLFHWRDGQEEVDLIVDHPVDPLALEIASRPGHSRRGLRAFMERHPRFAGRCYIVAPEPIMRTPDESEDGIGSLPLDLLLLAVGRHAELELEARLRA